MDLDHLLGRLGQVDGSDLHIKFGAEAAARADGTIFPLGGEPLTASDLHEALTRITEDSPARREEFERTGEVDTSYTTAAGERFRVSAFRQRGHISMVFRRVADAPRSLTELEIPDGVMRLADSKHGLIIISGATGSGKSSTLAGMISQINNSRSCHIVTLEDPIEVMYQDNQAFINQREIGVDSVSYKSALRRVLRQDPDVIVIGELRDSESAETALAAGESGHLVFTTMHTADAVETINRFVEFFPGDRQESVRHGLAAVLRGAIAQRLLPKVGGGRVPAVEVLVNTARAADMIREQDRTAELADVIASGEIHGMQSFDDHLTQLVLNEKVEEHIAAASASEPHDFKLKLGHARRLRDDRAQREADEAGQASGATAAPNAGAPPSLLRKADGGGSPLVRTEPRPQT